MPRLVPSLLLLLLTHAAPASAQVHRCAMPNGVSIYTDRRCEDLGAAERVPETARLGARNVTRPMCARTLRDLAHELSSAIEARDVNRLAGAYDWAGMSTGAGFAVMSRLQAIVDRPLVDLQPIYPQSLDADLYPQNTSSRPPIGFRLDQVVRGSATPVRSTFGIRKHLDCWWVTGSVPRSRAASPPAAPVVAPPVPLDGRVPVPSS